MHGFREHAACPAVAASDGSSPQIAQMMRNAAGIFRKQQTQVRAAPLLFARLIFHSTGQ